MPTLCFDASFDRTERCVLTKTFKSNCRDIGVSGVDATIELRRAPIGEAKRMGCISRLAKDRFVVMLNTIEFSMAKAVFSLGHEIVHFDQYMRGDLSDDRLAGDVIWKGKRFPLGHIDPAHPAYIDLPWEIEAQQQQDALFERALRGLGRDEALRILGEDAEMRRAA